MILGKCESGTNYVEMIVFVMLEGIVSGEAFIAALHAGETAPEARKDRH